MIQGFVQAPQGRGSFPQSIMSLSSTGTAGRGSSEGDIVGTVINHGMKQFWEQESGFHYHTTLSAGECTLEGQMARLAVRHFAAGDFDRDRLQSEYVSFMTTPGAHNDAYCSSYHRLFFQRRATGIALRDCPSNDNHNVDSIDGLVMPSVVLLATAEMPMERAIPLAQESVRVTRNSPRVEQFVVEHATLLRAVLEGQPVGRVAQRAATRLLGQAMDVSEPDPVVACYIDENYVSLLHFAAKYGHDFRTALLANANAGGENVHRGLVLGALMGAQAGASGIPSDLKGGLLHAAEIEAEIRTFVAGCISGTHRGDGETCTGADAS